MGAGVRGIDTRLVVAGSALAAAVLRFPGLLVPAGADESGFTLVARHWDPQPDSMFGPYWLDRPPAVIALVKVSDMVGGPTFLRVVAAVGCALLVVLAAATARAALRYAGEADERMVTRTGAWTAVLTAAFTSNSMIDTVMAKGEVLGIPFVVLSFWLTLLALNRPRVDGAGLALAMGSGFAATMALGMKQNMVGGLVFAAVILVGSRLTHRLSTGDLLRLGAMVTGGALVPMLATAVWAVSAGVRLESVWYAIYGFRSQALAVILESNIDAPAIRAMLLLGTVIATGMAFVVAGAVAHVRRLWLVDGPLTVAALVVVAVDTSGLVLSGSYWQAYLFILIPGVVLCTTLLLSIRVHVARRVWLLTILAMVSALVSSVVRTGLYVADIRTPTAVRSGEAIAAASEPGDTIVVYGGRAELVLASGLESPYEHLWSLPMRTRDPDLDELKGVLRGPDAPTWLVFWAPRSGWNALGESLTPIVDQRYEFHGLACDDHPVYLLAGESRPAIEPNCDD